MHGLGPDYETSDPDVAFLSLEHNYRDGVWDDLPLTFDSIQQFTTCLKHPPVSLASCLCMRTVRRWLS